MRDMLSPQRNEQATEKIHGNIEHKTAQKRARDYGIVEFSEANERHFQEPPEESRKCRNRKERVAHRIKQTVHDRCKCGSDERHNEVHGLVDSDEQNEDEDQPPQEIVFWHESQKNAARKSMRDFTRIDICVQCTEQFYD